MSSADGWSQTKMNRPSISETASKTGLRLEELIERLVRFRNRLGSADTGAQQTVDVPKVPDLPVSVALQRMELSVETCHRLMNEIEREIG